MRSFVITVWKSKTSEEHGFQLQALIFQSGAQIVNAIHHSQDFGFAFYSMFLKKQKIAVEWTEIQSQHIQANCLASQEKLVSIHCIKYSLSIHILREFL